MEVSEDAGPRRREEWVNELHLDVRDLEMTIQRTIRWKTIFDFSRS